MKKLYSLLKACMTSDMNIFKLNTRNKNKLSNKLIPVVIALYLMFVIWGAANEMFEQLAPLHIQVVLLSLIAFGVSIVTLIEGIYKSGSLLFNCKDDDLLLSLPIKRKTVLLVRIFKLYVFETVFNSIFLLPFMLAYIRWADNLNWTYYLTSIVMILVLPIIPIILSCFIGFATSGLSSRFKYKNLVQIVLSMFFLLIVMGISFNTNSIMGYLSKNATSMNDVIIKMYYPAGMYAKLIANFNIVDLLIFILIHIVLVAGTINILGKKYFNINTRMKKVTTSNNKINVNNLEMKANSKVKSLVRKEMKTFFNIPVFIINAGFALVLYLIAIIAIVFKYDTFIAALTNEENGLGISGNIIFSNLAIFILFLTIITAFMTSITSSVISLEGRNINILKSLPINTKTILLSKVLTALLITTPVLLIGNMILFIKFKVSIIEALLLLVLSIVIPLISHFIGIIINLKYPKFDWESSTEVVKQSISSFISVMFGMVLLIISIAIISFAMGHINSVLLLIVVTIVYSLLDLLLYLYIVNRGVKIFNSLMV